MLQVTLYSRQGCHLCERALEVLEEARREAAFQLKVVDIDCEDDLYSKYNEQVPVIAINGQDVFGHDVERTAFLRRLRQT